MGYRRMYSRLEISKILLFLGGKWLFLSRKTTLSWTFFQEPCKVAPSFLAYMGDVLEINKIISHIQWILVKTAVLVKIGVFKLFVFPKFLFSIFLNVFGWNCSNFTFRILNWNHFSEFVQTFVIKKFWIYLFIYLFFFPNLIFRFFWIFFGEIFWNFTFWFFCLNCFVLFFMIFVWNFF